MTGRKLQRLSVHGRALSATLVAVAFLATATTVTPAAAWAAGTADPGSLGVRLLDIPADATNDPRARSYIVDELAPGTTIERRIEVSNTTETTLQVSVYAAAASIADGTFLGAADHTANDLSSWTTPDHDTLAIPAGGTEEVTVTVAVPSDAPPGEQYAVIWAQAQGPSDGTITMISRVGIRLYLAVSGDNPLASGFTIDTITALRDADGNPVVQAQVTNTGGRALDLTGTLTMAATDGTLSAGPYDARLGTTLAPGQSEPVTFTVTDQVQNGPWLATIELHSGLLQETYQAEITFPTGSGAGATVTAEQATDGTAWMLWLIAILLLVLLVLIVIRSRRHIHRPTGPQHATA